MARRSAEEMIERFRGVVASQSEDEIASFLEDIMDSVNGLDESQYVMKSEYDAVVAERDQFRQSAQDYRERYINRFYNPGNDTNDITIVQGGAAQLDIEKEEKRFSYDDLFE